MTPKPEQDGRKGPDRRSHDRIHTRLPISADLDGRRVPIVLVNLSEGGAYCRSEVSFPIMTRMEVSLELPGEVAESAVELLRLPAVVVRCEPNHTVGANWNLALFFAQMEATPRARLARFLKQRRSSGVEVGRGRDS